MCCFTGPVTQVAGTKIFARFLAPGQQALAYAMRFSADEDVAMALPLPVTPGAGDDAVRFVSLEGYPDLLADMERAFPPSPAASHARGGAKAPEPRLPVQQVGAFEASFVPRIEDFARLDERFRLPDVLWSAVPAYADYGFAVFKLRGRPPARRSRLARLAPWRRPAPAPLQAVHPLALVFPSRRPDALFLPTLHLHDGELRSQAWFDHAFFLQGPFSENLDPNRSATDDYRWSAEEGGWVRTSTPSQPLLERSSEDAAEHVRVACAAGLVAADEPLFRFLQMGYGANEDMWVPLDAEAAPA